MGWSLVTSAVDRIVRADVEEGYRSFGDQEDQRHPIGVGQANGITSLEPSMELVQAKTRLEGVAAQVINKSVEPRFQLWVPTEEAPDAAIKVGRGVDPVAHSSASRYCRIASIISSVVS